MTRLALAVLLAAAQLPGQFLRGVNLAGPEFGENTLPGRLGSEYTWNSEGTFWYFASKGLNLVRIPFRWERMQPLLRGPLDAEYLGGLKQNVAWARKYGLRVIIEPHNYGRYKIDGREYVIDNAHDGAVRVSTLDLLDFWERMSEEFRDEDTVYAYDLMNEPHNMGSASWKVTSQTVLSAIRNRGDNKLIMVPGDDWSSANRWVRNHGTQGWIVDPANRFSYQAHQYFDPDESGRYRDGYTAPSEDFGAQRVAAFLDWCRNNGARGFLGEYGVPNDDPRWLAVLDRFLAKLDEAGVDSTYWAAGDWWGDYKLSIQPRDGADRVQLATLQAHGGASVMTSVSAADGNIEEVAPGEYASGYGWTLAAGDQAEVLITDSAGVLHTAVVSYVSALQINYVVPAGAAPGRAEVVVRSGDRVTAVGTLRIRPALP